MISHSSTQFKYGVLLSLSESCLRKFTFTVQIVAAAAAEQSCDKTKTTLITRNDTVHYPKVCSSSTKLPILEIETCLIR